MRLNEVKIETRIEKCDLKALKASALLVGVFNDGEIEAGLLDDLEAISPISIRAMIDAKEIRGEFKEYTLLHLGQNNPIKHLILMGLGRRSDFYLDKIRSVSARAVRTLRKAHITKMAVAVNSFPGFSPDIVTQAIVEGTMMGTYRATRFTFREDHRATFESLTFLVDPDADEKEIALGAHEGAVLANAVNLCRDLANEPGNSMTPTLLAEEAKRVAAENNLEITVWGRKEIAEREMGGILAVSQGSREEPRFIVMRHHGAGPKGPTLALVGKGITFDSGGISIKPAERMAAMKYDMAGAAAVIAAMQAIAKLEIPLNVMGIIPSSENLPDGKAYKPGDVIKMYGPKYVEVVNTDAEGRMILADALHYACTQEADCIIDVATLTGGCVIALGTMVTGIMSNSDWLCRQIIDAGISHEEKMWRLPLFPEYDIQIRSNVADITNSGGRPASASTAGKFLQEFVDRPWAHLDIAGTAWIEEDNSQYFHQPYLPKKGATGWGVRTLTIVAQMLVDACEGDAAKLRELLQA